MNITVLVLVERPKRLGEKIIRTMTYLRAAAVRWEDDHFPGFVEVEFLQADGTSARFVAKTPEFREESRLTRDASYPIALEIGCDVTAIDRGRGVASIDLPLGDESYEVPLELLGDLPSE